ncbi:MAG: hypothetical protein ACXWDL_08785 [Nocardioides sp.]
MADRLEKQGDHPVVYGLLALVGVGVVVGLVMGLAALAGSRVLGVGDPATASTGQGQASMYLPKLEETTAPTGPQLTLAPGEEPPEAQKSDRKKKRDKPAKPEEAISLSAAQTSVAPMQQIDLSGVYQGGEGAILQVQRFEGGSWTDFPATPVSVSNQTYSTYVLTGQPGVQRFRMLDTGSGKPSNEVRVTVG